jgi:hypothetical protein
MSFFKSVVDGSLQTYGRVPQFCIALMITCHSMVGIFIRLNDGPGPNGATSMFKR